MSSMVLVSAVLVSLALGVLVAYGVCLGFFWVMRRGAVVVGAQVQMAPVGIAVEG
jgi:hypothetical protein